MNERLYQDKFWIDREGNKIPIKKLDPNHVKNIITFLSRRALQLHLAEVSIYVAAEGSSLGPSGDMAQYAFDQEFGMLIDMEPEEWLEQTPLMRALRARDDQLSLIPA